MAVKKFILPLLFLFLAGAGLLILGKSQSRSSAQFDGERALALTKDQLEFGPRTPGSQAHDQEIKWITAELEKNGWKVSAQQSEADGHPLTNIVATKGSGQPWVVLGAHYDSRLVADKDPLAQNRSQPIPGANDGASGVALLLELSRVLPNFEDKKVSLVFFDLEDQGKIPGWDWILGSRAYVQSLKEKPSAAIIVDMIGDADLQIYPERNSDHTLNQQIWQAAADLGYGTEFISSKPGYSLIDDHSPFLEKGIPAVDIIDFDYPYHHTLQDDFSKISARSLSVVGNTLLKWLREYR